MNNNRSLLLAFAWFAMMTRLSYVHASENIHADAFATSATISFASAPSTPDKKPKAHRIKSVEAININTPEGTVPRLPYQVYVTYSDGSHEWRQTRWTNALSTIEIEQADKTRHPAGTTYTIEGFIIGDNTTANGYPITATINVTAEPWTVPSPQPKAETLPLGNVTIEGNNRLTSNRDLDIKRLLSLDITQQLYNYRDTYGLPTDGYTTSDGWDSPTTKLKGHGTGHYMSALAFAFASAQDKEQKQQLYSRIERMVRELRECQERTFVWSDSLGRYFEARDYAPEADLKEMKGNWQAFNEYKLDYKHYGYGYLNAIPAAHPALIECYRAYNNEEWVWAPYYTIHKQLAGLIDIANVMRSPKASQHTLKDVYARPKGTMSPQEVGNMALQIARDMGLWVWNRLHYRTYVKTDGTRADRQARPGNRYEMWNMYIAGEVGGMEESLARLAEMTSDTTLKARFIEASNYFDAPAFFDPVAHNIDDIRTRHANQHIPMITGALRSYRTNGNPYYYNLALNFWNLCQGRYVYAMGGVGNGEMFRQPYTQILSMNTNVQSDWHRDMYPNPDINETCCAYNLAKLTKDLNAYDPDNAAYMDYYERVLYNQIIGSLNPKEWGVCYQYAVGMNATKPFGNETPQSTCCGGTGVENHVKYQEAAYFVNNNTIWVGLYMPTTAKWAPRGQQPVIIVQECQWPAEQSKIRIKEGQGRFAMKLRVPYWATDGFSIRLNGKSIAKHFTPSSYVEIPEREWTEGDIVEVVMPFTKHINWGPEKMDLAATGKNETRTPFNPEWVGTLMYGPLVMATGDIKEWKDAEFSLSSDLREIRLLGASSDEGTNGHIYNMLLTTGKADDTCTIHFTPDYCQTGNSTHYLRLNLQNGVRKESKRGKVDKTALSQALAVANQRVEAQNSWNALEVKVPEFAPWAPNGYARLQQALAEAEAVSKRTDKALTQTEVDKTLSELNVAINTMRPGNLAEPEDLAELLPLLTQSKNIANKSTELRESINYAEMVVQYVNDGSGTLDLIIKALNRLRSHTDSIR